MSDAAEKVRSVEAALGRPFEGELTPTAQRLKRNLLAVGWAVIFKVAFGIKIETDVNVLGVKLLGLDYHVLHFGLVVVLAYMLVHFIWSAVDAIGEWRLRLTGTRVAFITGARFTDEGGDYPDDPRQSTLYNWWLSKARTGGTSARLRSVEAKVTALVSHLTPRTPSPAPSQVENDIKHLLEQVNAELGQLRGSVRSWEETLKSARIPASLARFDAWFKLFLRSSTLRWFVFEIMLPCATGLLALALLLLA